MKTPESNSSTSPAISIEDMTKDEFEALFELVTNPQAAMDALPEEERLKYEEAQQSVVDARNSAPRVEGNLWII